VSDTSRKRKRWGKEKEKIEKRWGKEKER